MSDEWGPWVEHDGKGCPCIGMLVETVHEDGDEWIGIAGEQFDGSEHITGSSWHWNVVPRTPWSRIIRYRIRRPKALQKLIKMVENLPVRKPQYEDA